MDGNISVCYNMDCMDGMKQFPDKFFDLAIVDPPYGLGIDGQKESIFTCENPGRIAEAYAGRDRAEQWSGLWHIFIPEGGDRTLSEYTDEMLRQRRKDGSGTILQLARFLKVEE